jgi:hypothetical protein
MKNSRIRAARALLYETGRAAYEDAKAHPNFHSNCGFGCVSEPFRRQVGEGGNGPRRAAVPVS